MWTFLFLIFVLGAGLCLWEYAGRHLLRGIGEAPYVVLERYGRYEIREYAPFVSAEVSVSGDVETAMSEGFSILSSYLSRLDGDDAPIPDSVDRPEAGETHVVAFALPSRHSMRGASEKTGDSRITFRVVPARIVAALPFRGTPTEKRIGEKERLLRDLLRNGCHEPMTEEGAETDLIRLAPPYSMPLGATSEIAIAVTR